MRKTWRRIASVILALAMVVLALPEYVSPVKKAKAAASTRTIYELTNSLTDNHDYLIVSGNSVGNAYALSHNNQNVSSDGVAIVDKADYSRANNVFIEPSDVNSASVWHTSIEDGLMVLKNGSYYLHITGNGNNANISITETSTVQNFSGFNWRYGKLEGAEENDPDHLYITYLANNGNQTRYLHWTNGWGGGFSATNDEDRDNVYIFVKREICEHEYAYKGITWDSKWLLGEVVVTAYAEYTCSSCNQTLKLDATVTKTGETESNSCTAAPKLNYSATISANDSPDGQSHEDEYSTDKLVEDQSVPSAEGKVYVLADSVSAGNKYLVVSANQAGAAAYALANGYPHKDTSEDIAVKNRNVTIETGELTIDGVTAEKTYIKLADTDAIWTLSGTNGTNGYYLSNGDYYLYHMTGGFDSNSNNWRIYLSETGESGYKSWNLNTSSDYLRYEGTNNAYYVHYTGTNSNPWRMLSRNNKNSAVPNNSHVYFFKETTITMTGASPAASGAHSLPLTEHAATPATCTQDGVKKYYECEVCHHIFSDSNAQNEITQNDLVDPMTGHDWVFKGFTLTEDAATGYGATADYECTKTTGEVHKANPTVTLTLDDSNPAKHIYTASIAAGNEYDGEEHSEVLLTINRYKIKFVDSDDLNNAVLKAEDYYNEGTLLKDIKPADPVRENNDEYTYVFAGWDPAIDDTTKVTEDNVYKATYTKTAVTYTIRFITVDDNGNELEVLQSEELPYGATPSYKEETSPTKDPTAQYEYTFSGWSPEIRTVDGNQDYVAQFTETDRLYTIRFITVDDNGDVVDVLQSNELKHGATPAYTGDTPTKNDPDGVYAYTFSGWSPAIANVTGDRDYVAQFTSNELYNVNIGNTTNGTVRSDVAKQIEGGEVILTIDAASGFYYLDGSISVKKGETSIEVSQIGNDEDGRPRFKFAMPDGDVDVTATFYGTYPIWIAGTQITTVNQDNVLGDAAGSERITFSETTDKYVLTILTGDEITLNNNADVWNSLQKALIYIADTATKPLEIVASDGLKFTSETAYHGIFNESGKDLTVNGNVSIKLASEIEGGQELNGIYCLTSSMTITGDVTLNFPNGKYGNGNGLFAGDGCDITISGDVDITGAGSNAIRCVKLTVEGKKLSIKGLTDERYDYGISAEDTISIKCDGDGVAILAQTYAICCAGDVEITGDVDATGKWNNAIESDGNVTIKGNVFLGSDGNGIYAENIDITGDVSNNNYGIGGSLLYCYNGDITVDGSIKADCPTGYLLYARTMSETKGKITVTKDITGLKGGSAETADGITAWAGITINGNVDMQVTNEGPVIGDVADNVKHYGIYAGIGDLKIDGTLKLDCAETVDYGLYVVNGATGNGTVTLSDEVSITMSSGGFGIYATGTITLPEARTEISTNEGTAVFMSNIGENDIVIPEGYGISTPEDGEVRVIVDATDYDFYTIVDPTSPDVAASVVVIEPYIEVQFVNADEDQTVLATTKGFVGKAPKYTGETPTKKETDAETYTFDGWSYGEATYASDDLPTITEDMTGPIIFTAAYLVETKQYEVTFYDEDGKTVLLETATYDYGTKPEDITTPETPTKKDDDQYTYEFEGWDPELAEVTKNAAYTAKYKKVLKEFTIKFVNEDGKELQSTKVAYGTTPTYTGTTPTKEETAQFRYVFDGWTPEIVEVTGEATYTAKFAEKTKSYTIKFVNEDGTELQSSAVDYGKKPEYTGATPTKAADSQYTYTFKEWSPEIVTVTGEATYKATYDKKEISADDPVEEKGEYQLIGDKKISYKQKSGAVIKAQIKCTLHDENTFSKHKDVKSSKRTLVEGVDYKKTKGSVIIEFLPEYLDSLEVGSTMITVSFEDGNDVEIELEILPADAEEQKESPKTDDSMVFAWIIFLIGAASFSFMLIAKKREREERVGL